MEACSKYTTTQDCPFDDKEVEIIVACIIMVLLSCPVLFLLILGPVADVALSVGRVRTEICVLISELELDELTRTESGTKLEVLSSLNLTLKATHNPPYTRVGSPRHSTLICRGGLTFQ